jgi:TonB-dependent receptor
VERVAPSSFSQNRPLAFGALLAAFLILPVSPLPAQQFGGIRGQLVDSDFGQPIAKASVTILDTPFGAITDDQGNFTISGIPAGTYTLQTRASSYIPKTIPEVTVAAGSFNDLRLEAVAEIEEMEELVVPGEIEKASETGLLAERQEATAVMDMIGQDFISRIGASTAGDAMKRITGTTVQDDKYVSVRGLSDRYVNTLLNGGRLPSTDPDKRAVNVDLFPGSAMESINVIKTFTPDQFGDFTGGSVDLRTRTYPEKASFGLSTTVEYNSQTSFNPNFQSYAGGGTGPFGLKANQRFIPQSVTSLGPNVLVDMQPPLIWPNGLATGDQINDAMRQMSPVLSLKPKTPGPNTSINLQGGDEVDFGNEQKMGVFGAFSHRHKFSYYGDGTRNLISRTLGSQDLDINSFQQGRSSESVLWGSLFTIGGQLDKDNRVSMNLIFNEQATDTTTSFLQNGGTPLSTIQANAIQYGERQLAFAQLTGDHTLPDAYFMKITWNGGLSEAQLLEPDQRAFQALYDEQNDRYSRLIDKSPVSDSSSPALRFQRQLNEVSYYTIADFLIPYFGKDDYSNSFKTGWYTDVAQRNYTQNSYDYVYGGATYPEDFISYDAAGTGTTWSDVFLNPDRSGLVNPAGIKPATGLPTFGEEIMSWSLRDLSSDNGSFYTASQTVMASYVMTTFKPFEQLEFVGGARFENTYLDVASALDDYEGDLGDLFPEGPDNTITQLDLLPAVGATFQVMQNVNFRLAWSQTLARPSFKEIGPIITQDFGDSALFVGNPFIDLSTINNYDMRLEWFPRAGEVMSVSLFYKDIQAPIEQNIELYGLDTQLYRYDNAVSATVWGWEVEFRKRLDQLHQWTKDFSIYFNFAQIQSQVLMTQQQISGRTNFGQTGDTRPLQGQPNYIINAGLNYDNPEYRFYAGLYYNVTGPFLYAAGLTLPDVYQQPAPSLDFNLTQGLTENWKMTFRAKNLLNPFFRQTTTINGIDYETVSFTKGYDLSLNVSYSF